MKESLLRMSWIDETILR